MKHALKTKDGRAAYALRKQTVEPVFGIIKSVMGFRQFLLRGLENVRNEWTLVCLAWNLKRMAVLRPMRGQRFGDLVLAGLLQAAKARGDKAVLLHAQCSAEGFYKRSGFVPHGVIFEEAGIAHIEMVCQL